MMYSKLYPVSRRSGFGKMLKILIETCKVVKPALNRYLGDIYILVHKQLTGVVYADFIYKMSKGFIGFIFKVLTKGGWCHMCN